jgi:hypothetical protein
MRTGPITDAGPAFISPVAKLGEEDRPRVLRVSVQSVASSSRQSSHEARIPFLQDIEINIESL